MTLNKENKEKLYQYCCDIGFIVNSANEWKESKKEKKIKSYLRKGYRIILSEYQKPLIINIYENKININIKRNLEDLYYWLIKERRE